MILQLFTLAGALGMFLYGMNFMSAGLQKASGDKLRGILTSMTSNPLKRVLTGLGITALVQSSSATTVLVVSFVNAGLLTLVQAVGIIMGANIGTTLTAWVTAVGFSVDISAFSVPLMIFGFILTSSKKPQYKNVGEFIVGFALMFLGLSFMKSSAGTLLSNKEAMMGFFSHFTEFGFGSDLIFLLAGTILTIVLQASSATMAITMLLTTSGLIDFELECAMVLGENIGTTITANMAAAVGNTSAKRAALAHTVFNVFTTLLLLPFSVVLAKLCEKIIPTKNTKVKYQKLEPHLLDTPPIALAQTTGSLRQMLKKAWKMIDCTLKIYLDNDEKNQSMVKQLEKREADIDERQIDITNYLSELMLRKLTSKEAEQIPMLLHCTNDVERIGDHAEYIRGITEKLNESETKFSPEAEAELRELHKTLEELAFATADLLEKNTIEAHSKANKLQQQIFATLDRSEAEHLARINNGGCRPQVGILYLELMEEIRKISRHLENINDRSGMFYEKLPNAAK